MKNIKKEEGEVSGSFEECKKDASAINSLPRMEMYAVLGLELGKRIFEMLQGVDKSVEIVATEMQRQKQETKTPDTKGK